jgi:HD-GYP domain-containing protein (c-di-GMP phosphodiesterase class II)
MAYVAVPLSLLELGKPVPVDIWDPQGTLLLRRGQSVRSPQHKDMLHDHGACVTEIDARAWQRSYERVIHNMIMDGHGSEAIASTFMPSEVLEADYVVPQEMLGGWLDLQEVLRVMLYQGEATGNALERLEGLELKALELLRNEPDESLFTLFQALADDTLGYCASHALLCAAVCELTAGKIGMAESPKRVLFRAALTMNIGMARAQDALARQASVPNDVQRTVIRQHPERGAEVLRGLGVVNPDHLDIVLWHHETDESRGMARNLECRRLLRVADAFVAKMAARRTRLAMSALGAAKAMYTGSDPHTPKLVSAMATAVGFYPPGTYVQLVNGERAVVVARGARANDAHVVSIVNAGGMPQSKYAYRDIRESQFAIRTPVNPEKIRVKVSADKVFRTWKEHLARASQQG